MLVKIIQENGIDVDGLIDKWNNEVEMEEKQAAAKKGKDSANTKSVDVEMNKEHEKYEFLPITVDNSIKSRSIIKGDVEMNKEHEKYEFLPITVDNSIKSRSIIKGVPKLNFEVIKK